MPVDGKLKFIVNPGVETIMQPFLKWPGGKRWLFNEIIKYLPEKYNTYFEPFLGGGAVFFAISPPNACISDLNKDLINLYITMRDNHEELANQIKLHQKKHCKEYYYQTRGKKFRKNVTCAGQFLYMNRSCYNGMYRVNKKGEFNVPIGTKTDFTYDLSDFSQYSSILKKAQILVSDFEQIIDKANWGDVVFADPPYVSNSNKNGFLNYNNNLFTWEDQKRLFNSLLRARSRGVKIISTNVMCKEIMQMYKKEGFKVLTVSRTSTISGKNDSRQKVKELLIVSR